MVRVLGPLFSRDAAGQFANRFIFRKAGRGHTAYPYFRPAQPQSTPQLAQRLLFSFLITEWPNLTTPQRETWDALVPGKAAAAHLAYLSYNLDRWQRFASPAKAYPAAEEDTPTDFFTMNGTGGKGYIDWPLMVMEEGPTWRYMIFRQTTPGITPAHDNASQVFIPPGEEDPQILHDIVPAGTYYAKLSTFSPDGVWFHNTDEISATAT